MGLCLPDILSPPPRPYWAVSASTPTITELSEGGAVVILLLYLNLAREDAVQLTFRVRLAHCSFLLGSLGLISFGVALAALHFLTST